VDRRLELELPVAPIGLQSKEPDAGEVDDVLTVNPDESEGFELRSELTDRPDVDEQLVVLVVRVGHRKEVYR